MKLSRSPRQEKMLPPATRKSSSKASTSSYTSSDFGCLDEPRALREAHRGTGARGSSRVSKAGSGASRLRSKGFSSRISPGFLSEASSTRPSTASCVSQDHGSKEHMHMRGGNSTEFPFARPTGRRPCVSFVDEVSDSCSDEKTFISHSSLESAAMRLSVRSSRFSNSQHISTLTPEGGDRFRAHENVRRDIAALEAERLAIAQLHTPELDDVELKVKEFLQQLHDVRESVHSQGAYLLNSLVDSTWTIRTTDTLAKRMLRPAKCSPKSYQLEKTRNANADLREWFGPPAIDVFGDCLVVEQNNPYRIVGVFARRYWDTRKRLPHLKEPVCSPIFQCIHQAEQHSEQHRLLQIPSDPPPPIKAFRSGGTPSSSRQTTPSDSSVYGQLEDATSGEPTPRRDFSPPVEGSSSASSAATSPTAQAVCGSSRGQALRANESAPSSERRCSKPSHPCAYVGLPKAKQPRFPEPLNLPEAPVEISNIRIPTLLSEYLEKNCVNVERPTWDKNLSRKSQKVKRHHSDSLGGRHDDSDSSCDEAEADDFSSYNSQLCRAPSGLQHWDARSIPQFFRREIGNRWLPTIFSEADVRISEYWKLENMSDRDKAVWVYQGVQTEPKPYPWEEVPLEGRPLSQREVERQRRAEASRRRLSKDAPLLLRGVELNKRANSRAADTGGVIHERGRTSMVRHPSEQPPRRRSSALPPAIVSRASLPPNCAGSSVPPGVSRRVR
ncbi:hypothetical protein Efla_002901 [Eimeria flavescens]